MNRAAIQIKVGLDFGSGIQPVGRLAHRDNLFYFEFDKPFIEKEIEISPYHFPLKRGLIELPRRPFEGLAGVFSDSLPDGWGRMLFDRMARSQGMLPGEVSVLDRLIYVGLYGMGALVYEPDYSTSERTEPVNLDQLATWAERVVDGSSVEVLSELLAINGSSAGARPKALVGLDGKREKIIHGTRDLSQEFDHWLVKFPNSQDGNDAGAIEFVYAEMAKEAGLTIPETHLFPSDKGRGFFAVKRFDRDGKNRLHMHTAAGLLHSDFRFPSLDYKDLLNLTGALTKDVREIERMYRMAVFNVMAYNRDDHAKNFSFLMNERGEWKLSPSYDITFSNGPGGEQSTMVMGEGKNLTSQHLTDLGLTAGLSRKFVDTVLAHTREALKLWPRLSRELGVKKNEHTADCQKVGCNGCPLG